jgi:hypothetical protein
MNTDLQQLLINLKGEADRLHASDPALSTEERYMRAVVAVFMTAAEEPTISPFEAKLLAAIRTLHKEEPRAIGFKKPQISDALNLDGMNIEEWNLWSALSSLEQRGLVFRPRGPRTHFWAVRSFPAAA